MEFAPFGVPNFGNTCYYGSLIVCLSSLPSFYAFLKQIVDQGDTPFCSLLMSCLRGERKNNHLFRLISQRFSRMISGQQDSHELFALVQEIIEDELKKLEKSGKHAKGWETLLESFDADKSSLEFPAVKLRDPFHGILAQFLKFQECKHQSQVSLNSFQILTCTLAPHLQLSLNMFCSVEQVQDVFCDTCKVKRNCLKQIVFARLPQILCIHLNRLNGSEKLQDHVSFPLHLQVAHQPLAPLPFSRSNPQTTSFTLMAVLQHHGGAGSGHYTSFRKHSKDSQRWLHISDETVRLCKTEKVLGAQAYMLFYERDPSET